jgi:hypothetical protein
MEVLGRLEVLELQEVLIQEIREIKELLIQEIREMPVQLVLHHLHWE